VKKSASGLSNKFSNQKSTESQHSNKNGADRRQSAISNTSATIQPPATGNGTSNGDTNGQWYVAVYDFQAVEATDLSLKVGDRIWVTENKDEWWHGSVDGRNGKFSCQLHEIFCEIFRHLPCQLRSKSFQHSAIFNGPH
jgi:hypothetical protein